MRSKLMLSLTILAALAPSAAHATVAVPAIPEPTGLALYAAGAAVVAIAIRLNRQR
jgi:hypothetical protein